MKILFIHNKYKQYGGEDVAAELESTVLKEKGNEVEMLFFENKINELTPSLRGRIHDNFQTIKPVA